MVYALLFEPNYPAALPAAASSHVGDGQLPRTGHPGALPPQHSYPAAEYTSPQPGHWRDTNDLEPSSVTETTTKLLDKQSEPPV
jgi:hypothetical protein